MAEASVEQVKELRERTGAGIMDCKAALKASDNDLEKASDYLRKKGLAQMAKRAGREAKEGLVAAGVSGRRAALVEVNCETDFVSRTDDFRALAQMALGEMLNKGEAAVASEALSNRLAELSGKIGEKMLIRRVRLIDSDNPVFTYIHSNQKLGVLVELRVGKSESRKLAEVQELGKNLAMQIAAQNPLGVSRADIPASVLEREKAIYAEEVKGKPQNILEKIVQGKLDKFYETACLLEQRFIRDDKMSVTDLLNQISKKAGDKLEVVRFVRFQLGEAS